VYVPRNTDDRRKIHTKVCAETVNGLDLLGDIGVDDIIILKWNLKR
jgi:hypothetical protein